MYRQLSDNQNDPAVQAKAIETPASGLGFSGLLMILGAMAAGTLSSLVLLPLLVPALGDSLAGAAPHAYWYLSRASAFVAFGLLWMSMLAGLGITNKLGRVWPGLPGSYELHKYTALLGLGFGMFHALILLGDHYINYSLGQILVPFMAGNYRPAWVGMGQIAFYSLAVVALSFYVKDRIGTRTWKLIHALSFALFLMVLIHGVQSGTDSSSIWATALYWVSGASVLFFTAYRIIAARMGRPKHALHSSGLLAVPGKAQIPAPKQPAVAQRRQGGRGQAFSGQYQRQDEIERRRF